MSEDDIKPIFDSIRAYNKAYDQYIEQIDKYIGEIKTGVFGSIKYALSIFAKSKAYTHLYKEKPKYIQYYIFNLMNTAQYCLSETEISSFLNHIDTFGLWTFFTGRLVNPLYSFSVLMTLYYGAINAIE